MFLDDFLTSVYVPSRLELSAGSVYQLRIVARLFQRWAGRPVRTSEFSEPLLRSFLADYRKTVGPATCNAKRRQLLALWRCAWEEELLPNPPRARKIRRAVESPLAPEAWSASEVGRLILAASRAPDTIAGIPAADFWVSLLSVIYDTGERISTVLRTAPEDVSLAGSWICFRRTKTGQQRLCPLHPTTVDAVRRIWSDDRSLLWPWPWSRETREKRFRALCRVAGLACGRKRGGLFHKIRRTTGTLVEAAGGDGARAIGNTRKVFERHYRDPRFFQEQLAWLPRPSS